MIEQIELVHERCQSLDGPPRDIEFLSSIKQYYKSKGSLSPGQTRWFESLKEKYSQSAVEQHQIWNLQFSDFHRETAINVAHYYRQTQYYQALVSKVFADVENFTLSQREWNRFCENKYALKVRNEYEKELRFKIGDAIQIRASNKVREANYNSDGRSPSLGRLVNRVGFVIKTDAKKITKARKGSRVYQVLLIGDTSPIYAHEADLKKAKKV
tara:strand:- start:12726 stop:13364 length:639 start_codon:yes stop_codon:yes gene_type:complete